MKLIFATLTAALTALPVYAFNPSSTRCTVLFLNDPTLLTAETRLFLDGFVAGVVSSGVPEAEFLRAVRAECYDRDTISLAVATRDALMKINQ